MDILISGVNGFIGAELLQALRKDKDLYHVFGTGRQADDPRNKYYHVNLTDKGSVRELIKKLRSENISPTAFVHCAAVMADAGNTSDPGLFLQNNFITENIILIVTELKIKHLVNLSSIAVYPNEDGEYSETSTVNPAKNGDCLYGLSKFCSEELFCFYLNPSGVSVTNLRIAQVYGNRMRQDRTFKIMENEMKETNKITVWSNGERVSNFVDVNFVVSTIVHFLNNPVNGLFNVGGENLAYKDLARKVIEMHNYQNVEICLVDKGVSAKIYINSDKLKRELQNNC